MKTNTLIYFLLAALLCVSCNGKRKSYDEMGSDGMTTRTENLQANLRAIANQGVLVGQQYGTLSGVGWRADSTGRSDMQGICGDHPACCGYELCGIERGMRHNVDSVSFDDMRKDVLRLFRRGGLIQMTWTAPDHHGDDRLLETWLTRVARFLGSLQDGYGIKAPVVLMLYPHDGRSWYTRLSADDYKALYQSAADKLKDLGVTNAVMGCSFAHIAGNKAAEELLPDGVDVLHADLRLTAAQVSAAHSLLDREVSALVGMAQQHNMAAAMTTGIQGQATPGFFSGTIAGLVKQYRLSYILFGANRGEPYEGRFYVPYPGCSNELIDDFVKFYNAGSTIFLGDLNGLYLKKD